MKFSSEWITTLGRLSVSPESLAEIFSAKSFEVKELIPADGDTLLDIDILPNRPDALSHEGLAREAAALTGASWTEGAWRERVQTTGKGAIPIRIDDSGCRRYSALVVRDVHVGRSPGYIRARLERLGLKSINNIVDITNYVMMELGQPVHAFDADTIDEIRVRRSAAGEHMVAVDEAQTEYALPEGTLVIADAEKPIAIAGIKGGAATGITDATKTILIESANFTPEDVRAASRALRLRTDASIRFSYGVDPELTLKALWRIAGIIEEEGIGTVDWTMIDVYPSPQSPVTVALNRDYIRSLLGENIPDGAIDQTLMSLGFVIKEDATPHVVVPHWRLDIRIPEDLAEEVGRTYGYERISSRPPTVSAYDERQWVRQEAAAWDEYEYIRERSRIAHQLAALGFSEVYTYALISEDAAALFGMQDAPQLALPPSSEYRYLRTSLLPRLVTAIRDNERFRDEVRMFEMGHTFAATPEDEKRRCAIVLARKNAKDTLFFELKGSANALFARLGIPDAWYDDAEPFSTNLATQRACIPGRRAEIKTGDGTVLGFIGALAPDVLDQYKIRGEAAVVELDVRALVACAQREREFAPLPKYPSVIRDIAVLVDPGVTINQILSVVQSADTTGIVEDVDVFDIYEPTPSEPGKPREHALKSVAFHVIFRSDERTLTDGEAEAASREISVALQEQLKAQVR